MNLEFWFILYVFGVKYIYSRSNIFSQRLKDFFNINRNPETRLLLNWISNKQIEVL